MGAPYGTGAYGVGAYGVGVLPDSKKPTRIPKIGRGGPVVDTSGGQSSATQAQAAVAAATGAAVGAAPAVQAQAAAAASSGYAAVNAT